MTALKRSTLPKRRPVLGPVERHSALRRRRSTWILCPRPRPRSPYTIQYPMPHSTLFIVKISHYYVHLCIPFFNTIPSSNHLFFFFECISTPLTHLLPRCDPFFQKYHTFFAPLPPSYLRADSGRRPTNAPPPRSTHCMHHTHTNTPTLSYIYITHHNFDHINILFFSLTRLSLSFLHIPFWVLIHNGTRHPPRRHAWPFLSINSPTAIWTSSLHPFFCILHISILSRLLSRFHAITPDTKNLYSPNNPTMLQDSTIHQTIHDDITRDSINEGNISNNADHTDNAMNGSQPDSDISSIIHPSPYILPFEYCYNDLISALPDFPSHLIFYDDTSLSSLPDTMSDTTEVQLCFPLNSFLPDAFANGKPLSMQDVIAKRIGIDTALRNISIFLTRQLQKYPAFAPYRPLSPFLYNHDIFVPDESRILHDQAQFIAFPLPLSLAKITFSDDFIHFQSIFPCGFVQNPYAQDSLDCPSLTITLFGALQHEEAKLKQILCDTGSMNRIAGANFLSPALFSSPSNPGFYLSFFDASFFVAFLSTPTQLAIPASPMFPSGLSLTWFPTEHDFGATITSVFAMKTQRHPLLYTIAKLSIVSRKDYGIVFILPLIFPPRQNENG